MEITLVCSLRATIEIPDDIKNEEEAREYLRWAYDTTEILKRADIEDFEIEEIEDCPNDEEDFDRYIDDSLLGE